MSKLRYLTLLLGLSVAFAAAGCVVDDDYDAAPPSDVDVDVDAPDDDPDIIVPPDDDPDVIIDPK